MMKCVVWALIAASLGTQLLVGCSSDDSPPTAAVDAGSADTGIEPVVTNDACFDTEDGESCSKCCGEANPAAADKYQTFVIKCFCQQDFCKEACKDSYCGSTDPSYADGSPCDLCIQGKNPTCATQTQQECSADPTCKPEITCLADSACGDK